MRVVYAAEEEDCWAAGECLRWKESFIFPSLSKRLDQRADVMRGVRYQLYVIGAVGGCV